MNILMLSWRGPGHPRAGGAEIVSHKHAAYWITQGHTVTLFTSYYENAKVEEVIDGVKVIRKGGEIFGSKIQFFIWYISINKEKYDIVIDEFHGIPFFTPLFIHSKKLAFIHEVTKNVWLYNPWPKPFYYIPIVFGFVFEPFVFRLIYPLTPFMTVSESTKKDLVSFGIKEKNIHVIENGTEIITIKNYKKESKKTAVFLGSLARDKGIEDAIGAFGEMEKRKEGWQFWIIGKGEPIYLKNLRLLAKTMGIEKNTTFWGYISQSKKFELLSKSHVLINPSFREGWGLTVIEAASVGVPTIGYNVPGLQDSIINGKTGILCENNTSASIADNTNKLLSTPEIYKKISKYALQWSKKFSWEKSSKKSMQLLLSITTQ